MESKTRIDDAQCSRALAEEHFPQAEKIVLVQDNLNTHAASSFTSPQANRFVYAARILRRPEGRAPGAVCGCAGTVLTNRMLATQRNDS